MNTAIVALLVLSVVNVYAQGGGGGGGGGGGYGHHGDHHHHHHVEEYIDYQSHPHYHFNYAVHDPKHHDVHDQWEHRDGHKTKGMYSLQQPDGRKRIVEYEADKHGINYKVKYEGHAIHEEGHKHHEEHHHQDHHHHQQEHGHHHGGLGGGLGGFGGF